ncbi:transposase [Niveispirillum fermenti]
MVFRPFYVGTPFRPGIVVKDVARRLGVHESLPWNWRAKA